MMPSFIFIFKIRRTDSLRRSSVISPVSTALMTAGTCTSKSVQHSISFPACTALTAISASPANCRTPSMTRSSVMITPSNPNSLRKILCTGREIDAGTWSSMQETTLWATSTISAPASMPAWNGRKSEFTNLSMGRSSKAIPVCVSELLPYPGKCFNTLPICSCDMVCTTVRTYSAVCSASCPKLRA